MHSRTDWYQVLLFSNMLISRCLYFIVNSYNRTRGTENEQIGDGIEICSMLFYSYSELTYRTDNEWSLCWLLWNWSNAAGMFDIDVMPHVRCL